jgi:multiple sugar transport system substrate-binding protein
MFNQLLGEKLHSFVDLQKGQVHFLDGGFTTLLESVKKYGERGYIPRGAAGQRDAGQMLRQAAAEETERYFFKRKNNFSLVQQFSRGVGRRMMIRSAGDAGGIEDDDEIAGIESYGDGGVPFSYSQGFAMNARSPNKELAWAFLCFLLGGEAQLSTAFSPTALPLNNKAREQKAELVFSGAFMGPGMPLDENQRRALKNYVNAVETLSDRINSFAVQDTTINDMIAAEVSFFFGGARTAEDTARVLQNKADLYLNE